MYLVLLGPPGAGKGTQAVFLSRELGLAHVASGNLFREAQESGSELGLLARSYMEKGLLVPDEVTVKMVLERLAQPDCQRGCLLDGFPRTLEQAQALDRALASQGRALDKVLHLKVSQEELLRRLGGRWICRQCQAPYHLLSSPPRVPGRCDRCGGELYQRPDDTVETARVRLEGYWEQARPLVDYYARTGKLVEVDGEKGVEQVGAEMLAALGEGSSAPDPADAEKGIIIKSPQEIALMRQAGRIVASTLEALVKALRPGVTTGHLDALAEREIRRQGGIPSFKGYRGFPASLCTSINEEVVHGIPGQRALREGDLIALDVGVIYNGFQADAALSAGVGKIAPEAKRLLEAARGALGAGIAAARNGARLGDISAAIQGFAEAQGFAVVREYVGHGIGRAMHEEPQVPNFGLPGRGPLLRPGIVLALEPMLNEGDWRTRLTDNGWTVVTANGRLSAHFEHTIAITGGEAEVLTRP